MTIAAQENSPEEDEAADLLGIAFPMTYEEYMASPEERRRYDIVDGIKRYRLYGPEDYLCARTTRRHQRIQLHLGFALMDCVRGKRNVSVFMPPCDVLISRQPLRCRQPDLLYISQERMAQNASMDDASPLSPAPELVVENLSSVDAFALLADRISDYRSVDVRELWLLHPDTLTVDVLSLSRDEMLPVATYGAGETVVSQRFPYLSASVDGIFAA